MADQARAALHVVLGPRLRAGLLRVVIAALLGVLAEFPVEQVQGLCGS